MRKLVLLFVFVSFAVFPQEFTVKQLTDFDFDIHNPTFIEAYLWSSSPDDHKLFFEVHNDDSCNIAGLKYDVDSDSFVDLKYFTRDGFVNRNPQVTGEYGVDPIILAWETNRNGNFDIAYVTKDWNTDWSEVQFLTETPEDETQMKIVNSSYGYVVFKRENAIIAKSINYITTEDTVFLGDDTTTYSYPGGGCDANLIVFAIKNVAGNKTLVYKVKFGDSWSEEREFSDFTGEPKNPGYYFYRNIAFETEQNDKNSINYIHLNEYWYESSHNYLFVDSSYSYSDFNTMSIWIVTKNIDDWAYPYAVTKKLNDETFVETILFKNHGYGEIIDTTLSVSVPDPEPCVGPVGMDGYFHVNYSVWVDSANGHRNLFGIKQYGVYVGVENEEANPGNFILYQNYPNPFNPTTNITYVIASPDVIGVKQSTGNSANANNATVRLGRSHASLRSARNDAVNVSLKIYDALGREVATLVNKKQSPGKYSVQFNARELPSGIYFYSLRVGDFVQTKKLVLLK